MAIEVRAMPTQVGAMPIQVRAMAIQTRSMRTKVPINLYKPACYADTPVSHLSRAWGHLENLVFRAGDLPGPLWSNNRE
jgi:hypothetical protein